MINKPALIRFDTQSKAWSDGVNFVSGKLIRRYAIDKLGRNAGRGRLSKSEISAYFLDKFGVSADVE